MSTFLALLLIYGFIQFPRLWPFYIFLLILALYLNLPPAETQI